jgi:hypothetical protein
MNTCRGQRATTPENSGTAASIATKVAVNIHGSLPDPALQPIASRSGRIT